MFKKKLLIASSHKDEAITRWIMQTGLLHSSVDMLFIQDLLDNFSIWDELDKHGPVIRWQDNRKKRYSNETHYLLNRLIHIEESLFDKFQAEDQEYAQREFEAYLGFAFNAFKSPQNQAINGICERYKTLPQQWQMVKGIEALSIPQYYWGSPHSNFLSVEKDLVHSDIYDCLNWSSNHEAQVKESSFRFLKPKGEPVFILTIGQKDLISAAYPLAKNQQEKIRRISQKIRRIFGYFIFELLLFVDEAEITFGCVNIDIVQSAGHAEFDQFMEKNFIQECSKCLN